MNELMRSVQPILDLNGNMDNRYELGNKVFSMFRFSHGFFDFFSMWVCKIDLKSHFQINYKLSQTTT